MSTPVEQEQRRKRFLTQLVERAVADAIERLPDIQQSIVFSDLRERGLADTTALAQLWEVGEDEIRAQRAEGRTAVLKDLRDIAVLKNWEELMLVLRGQHSPPPGSGNHANSHVRPTSSLQ